MGRRRRRIRPLPRRGGAFAHRHGAGGSQFLRLAERRRPAGAGPFECRPLGRGVHDCRGCPARRATRALDPAQAGRRLCAAGHGAAGPAAARASGPGRARSARDHPGAGPGLSVAGAKRASPVPVGARHRAGAPVARAAGDPCRAQAMDRGRRSPGPAARAHGPARNQPGGTGGARLRPRQGTGRSRPDRGRLARSRRRQHAGARTAGAVVGRGGPGAGGRPDRAVWGRPAQPSPDAGQ